MIKVLHFVSTPSIGSGVMSVIMNYYRHIDRSKIQFDFLCFVPCESSEQSHEKEIEELGGRVFFIPKPGISFYSLKCLCAFFRQHSSDYTWFHNHEVYLSIFLKPIVSKGGIPNFVVHSHATQYSDNIISAWRNKLFCSPIRFLSCYRLACSNAAGVFLYGKKALERGQFKVIYNAIDYKKFYFSQELRESLRSQLNLKDKMVIGHIGRFSPQKNHFFLLEIFKEIIKKRENAILLLVGDGELKENVLRKVYDSKIQDKVIFLGLCNNAEEIFNAMDIFVMPSLFEGLPVSCIEAQANGLACVVSDQVSREAQYTSNYYVVSGKSAAFEWADIVLRILTSNNRKPIFTNKDIFDIEKTTLDLQNFYLLQSGRNDGTN